jgi:hypothetical protein
VAQWVTLGLRHARKGVGNRALYRWLARDYRPLFPHRPERTRRCRRFMTQQDWTPRFLAAPTLLGVIDTDGIEWRQPRREGRSFRPIGRKGRSKHRWMVGGKRCLRLNPCGVVVAWTCDTAHGPDATVQPLIRPCEDHRLIWRDLACPAAEGAPAHLKLCARGAWKDPLRIETVRSRLTLVSHCKQVMPRVWESFEARLAFTRAALNVLVQWHGLPADKDDFVSLSIAEFSL